MQDIIFIKLGGSVITDKTSEKSANFEVISQLAQEISNAQKKSSVTFVIGHGAGSFGHPQAKKHRTAEGDLQASSKLGVAEVRSAVTELNAIVIKALTSYQLPSVTLSPYSFIVTKGGKINKVFIEPFFSMLSKGLMPVIHGDVVMDDSIGWTILSGETILNFLSDKFIKHGYKPKLIIEVGKTAGVLDDQGHTISEINQANFKDIRKLLKELTHADVTGGMLHKVQEALEVAKLGIPTLLISADKGNLESAIFGKKVQGTIIR